jgi:hypothetical protein
MWEELWHITQSLKVNNRGFRLTTPFLHIAVKAWGLGIPWAALLLEPVHPPIRFMFCFTSLCFSRPLWGFFAFLFFCLGKFFYHPTAPKSLMKTTVYISKKETKNSFHRNGGTQGVDVHTCPATGPTAQHTLRARRVDRQPSCEQDC